MKFQRILLASLLAPFLSGAAARAQAVLYTHDGVHGAAQYGSCVALLPDMNADGVADYAVGAPFEDFYNNGSRRGVVRLYSGRTDAVLRVLVGPGLQSEFGHSIAALPDISGDGRPDLLIGAPAHSGTHSKQGAAFLFNSSTGVQLGAYYGESGNEFLGHAVANLGDIDGDGRDDWSVSAPFADVNGHVNCGRVRIYNGHNGALIQDWSPAIGGALAGWTTVGLGDVNGDGKHDFAAGMPGYTDTFYNRTSCGAVQVVRGQGATLWGVGGWENFEQLGWSLAALGDVTGDGIADFAVGTPHYDDGGSSRGRVRAINGYNGVEVFELVGSGDGYKLGASLAPVGDWNGDGVRDLAVGAPGVPLVSLGARGQVRLHSGVDGAFLTSFWGWESDSDWGRAIAGGRDLNGDGKNEILVGAPAEDSNGSNAGTVRMFLGGVASPLRYGAAKTNSAGCLPRIDFRGAPSRTLGDNFHITASEIVANKAGMLFWGFTQVATPFGGGTLLVGQPLVRTTLQSSGGTGAAGACDGSFDFHFSQALMQQYALPAGQRLYAQYWHRDPGFALPNNLGLTNALRFDIAH
jgi:hypothetical protein